MSKRLQVVLKDDEFDQLRQAARDEGVTLSEWVRRALSRARVGRPPADQARKLAAVRAASRHDFPTADIEQMLEEIERGHEAQ